MRLPPGSRLNPVNESYLTLIPKVAGAERIEDFRSITLANASYKIVAKVLVNRLRGVIGDLTHESQSAFVPGRSILDSVALAEEVIHHVQGERGEDGHQD